MRSRRFAPGIAALALLLTHGCASHHVEDEEVARLLALSEPRPGDLVATFFPTWLGDAILLELPSGRTLLVDAGVGSEVDTIETYLRVRGIHRIDALLLTHPHGDHYGGMIELLGKVPVGAFMWNGVRSDAPAYLELEAELARLGVPRTVLRRGDRLDKVLGPGCDLEVLYPDERAIGLRADDNCSSIVLRVTHEAQRVDPAREQLGPGRDVLARHRTGDEGGQTRAQRLLLMGDAEELEELRLLSMEGPDALRADVLQLGHHAADGSGSLPFLRSVRPWLAVVMGAEGLHVPFLDPHPCDPVRDELREQRVPLLSTGEHGPVQVVSTGATIRAVTIKGRFLRWKDEGGPAPGP